MSADLSDDSIIVERNSKSILFVIGTLNRGGAENQLTKLACRLQDHGYECHVFALDARGDFRSQLLIHGVKVHDGGCCVETPLSLRRFQQFKACLRLMSVILRYRSQVLHAYLPLTNFIGAVIGRLCFLPAIITSKRALGTHQDRHPYLRFMDHWANRLSHQITVNSDAVRDDLKKRDNVPDSKIVRIYNGIACSIYDNALSSREAKRAEMGIGAQVRVIISVANLISYKGHVELIRAFAALNTNGKETVLWLAGYDSVGMQNSLIELAASLNVKERVCFLGLRSDVPELLAAADLFVLASHEEGFSNALLEALAIGLPVVATDVGGNREALNGGCLGRIVPARNPDLLAEAMEDLLNAPDDEPERRTRRQWVEDNFSVDSMVRLHRKLYDQILPK